MLVVAQNYAERPEWREGARQERCTSHEQGWGVAFPPVETFKQGQVSSNAISMNSGWPTAEGEGHLTCRRFVGNRGKTPRSLLIGRRSCAQKLPGSTACFRVLG